MVVLPLPLSPAMVVNEGSSSLMTREKPSTASVSVTSPKKLLLRNSLLIRRASSSGGTIFLLPIQEQTRSVSAGFDLSQLRFHAGALFGRLGTAGVEQAAGRRIEQRQANAGDTLEFSLCLEGGDTGYQQLGVGVYGVSEDVCDGAHLGQFTSVHDAHAFGKLRHQTHVVADQQHGGVEALLQVAQHLHDLALDDHGSSARIS